MNFSLIGAFIRAGFGRKAATSSRVYASFARRLSRNARDNFNVCIGLEAADG